MSGQGADHKPTKAAIPLVSVYFISGLLNLVINTPLHDT